MNQGWLERECHTYSRYLTGHTPDEYVVRKYVECHLTCARMAGPENTFDRFLTAVASRGPLRARLADVYASRFHKYSMLRKKLVLMLALLECSPASFEYLDGVDSAPLLMLAWRAAMYAAALPVSILLFLPVQVWMGRSS